ncbi:DUF3179 domain-containing protein [Flavimaricola marinus]|uniref:DUF3179 domain-containing protein n=1 Tax=Flavimaricola marinus TaxID=1819565 RepID=A0A238LJA5_9RHOB|nr:DUF3179 domain-containing protein [Flavimaricola marinus]SMY09692.1 hypothetical protein LOM8899_03864 [Flavimaricola marinus]
MRKFLASLIVGLGLTANAAGADPTDWAREWPNTDFDVTAIEAWGEILSGGPPRDGIPAINAPDFLPASEETRIDAVEPVMVLEIEGQTPRAYPVRYLIWHEIVNDEVGGIPVAVTFCPLCNSGVVFDRRVGADTLTFGVTGKLRNSDMIMFDRETESWWQQATGQGIVGDMTGVELEMLPGWLEGWSSFKERNPNGLVMNQPVGFNRDYGRNPYGGYDSSARPFLYRGEMPPHGIPPLARVVRVGDRAWPLSLLSSAGEISAAGLTLSWEAGQASALDDATIGDGREVGNVRVRDSDGRSVVHDVMFAFAFHAFWPEGQWMLPE